MAIKVKGTTVIDDARHISNIGVATVGILSANQITTDGSTNQSGVGVTNYVLTSGGTSGDISWQPVTVVGSGTLGGINVLEEGSQVGTAGSVININFVGNNVTATGVALGLTATVTISDDPTYNSLNVTGDVAIASTVGIGTRIDLIPYDTIDNGTLSFEGSAGQLFSITNDLTSGSIFSVNDVSGIPSIDVDADGTIQLAPYGSTEYVGIGTTNPTQKLDVVGTVKATSFTGDGSGLTNVTASTGTATTITLADESTDTECFLIFATDATGDQEPKTGSNLTFNSNTGALTATSFVKESNSGGFLKADGVEDTNTYLTSYTETQALDDVVGLGSDTTQTITVGTATTGIILRPDGTLNVSGVSTFTGDVSFGSTATFGDNDNLYFGDGNDLRIYHDGNQSYISDVGAGGLNIGGSVVSIRNSAQTQDYFVARTGTGAVELYYDNSKKFETTGAGVTVYGTTQTQQLNVSGVSTFSDDLIVGTATTGVAIRPDGTLNVTGVSTFTGDVSFGSTATFGDNDRLKFGDSDDLEIYHDGNQSYISDQGSGSLRLLSNQLRIRDDQDNAELAKFLAGGRVELYYDNSKKFETTGVGVSIVNGTSDTATIYGPSNLIIDPMPIGVGTTSGIVRIKGDLYVDGTTTQINSTILEIADFIVGVATTATSDLLTDGAGIGIGSDKTFLYEHNGGTIPSLKSSENLNVASGKGYQINQVEVLNATTLGSGVTNSSLTSVGILTSQIQITKANSTSQGGGQIYLNGATGNRIDFRNIGAAAPAFTTRSVGTKLVLWPALGNSSVDYGLGIEGNTLWYSVPQATNSYQYRWYGGETQLADLKGSGELVIGSTSLTGTSSQNLQVTGGAYVSGDVGIGTTNPTEKLHVEGNALVNGNLYLNDTNYLSSLPTGDFGSVQINGDGKGNWEGYSIDGHTVFISDNPSGSFGLFDDTNNHWAIRHFRGGSSYTQLFGGNNSTNLTIAGTDVRVENVPLIVNTTTLTGTASQNLQVTGGGYFSGDVGIGITNPGSTLAVGGTITELYDGSYWNVVTQADVGYGASQVPLNQYLGQLAFLDDYHPNGLRRDGGGSDDVVVGAGGSVGIGTDNPTQTLDVDGNVRLRSEIRDSNDSAGTSGYVLASNGPGSAWTWESVTSVGAAAQDKISEGDTSAEVIDTGSDGRFVVTTDNQERLRITAAGDVGIGNDDPDAVLDANPGYGTTYTGTFTGTDAYNPTTGEIKIGSDNNAAASAGDYVGLRFSIIGNGSGNANAGIFAVREQAEGNGKTSLAFATRNWGGNNDLTEKVRITSDGNVGIGTTNPTQELHVEGNALVNGNLYLNDTNYLSSLPTGDYGSVQINGSGVNDWEGYSIDGNAVFMDNGTTSFGLYDDVNNHWAIRHYRGGSSYTQLFGGDNSANLSVRGTDVRVENVPLIVNRTTLTGTESQNLQIDGGAYVSGDVGIGTDTPAYKLEVNGSFAATTKSFIIDHPTKNGMKLRYSSLEGPENGVYVRGRLKGNNTIELPEHWTGLVDEETITVNLTPIGRKAILHSVVDIVDNTVIVESANDVVDCFYTVFGERKDVEKLEVEF